jgi:hypothetical protein
VLCKIFGLTAEEQKWLQVVPYKGLAAFGLGADRPADLPLVLMVNVYGTTIKELIHEEFGDGIMSAIDFSMDPQRTADPKGDRVNVVLSANSAVQNSTDRYSPVPGPWWPNIGDSNTNRLAVQSSVQSEDCDCGGFFVATVAPERVLLCSPDSPFYLF